MILYNNPLLGDFIQVCAQLPQDERDQLEAFTGQPYDIDGAALGNYMTVGPKWVLKDGETPICIGGYVVQRPGVYRDFMLNTSEAFEKKYWFGVTRTARRTMDWILHNGAHRVECIAPARRLAARPQIEDWYKILGYNREATLYGYCANGADAVSFSRVRH